MGEPGGAQRCQRLGGSAPTHVAARIRPARDVGASRTGDRWLWTTPCWKRSPPTAPAIHLLHRVHTSRRLSPSSGLPPGLRRPSTVQFWLWPSAPTAGSVCPSRGPPATCHSRGSTAGLPAASVAGRPRHEQTPDGPAGLPLRSVWLRAGLERLRTGLLGPQPAAPLLRGPLRAGLGGPPRRRQRLRTRAEPQRARLPPVPTLTRTPSGRPRVRVTIRPGGRAGRRRAGGSLFRPSAQSRSATGQPRAEETSSALIENFRFLSFLFEIIFLSLWFYRIL